MISYVLPTRDRPDELARTLVQIAALGDHAACGGAEVVVVDNASSPPAHEALRAAGLADRLLSGVPVRVVRLEANRGAAARNEGVRAARGEWIVMLDDDSHPLDRGVMEAVRDAGADVAAVQAEITLPDGTHEAGGLPEVFIGCGVAMRRSVFVELGGYDAAFDYYAEEYDLAARMIMAGWRVGFDRRFRVEHRKVGAGRDFSRIVRRLVRNNAWVMQRYAPGAVARREVAGVVMRYGRIALREGAIGGWMRGVMELMGTAGRQPRRQMTVEQFDRFTGLAAARSALRAAHAQKPLGRCAIVSPGKNEWVVRSALEEVVVGSTDSRGAGRWHRRRGHGENVETADTLVIGTMSPGPMLDALARHAASGKRVVMGWEGNGQRAK